MVIVSRQAERVESKGWPGQGPAETASDQARVGALS